MCTLVVLSRPGHAWPLLLAGNRDEMRDRPWDGPSRHWDDRPAVVAGLDQLAGGSWMGVNDNGVSAVVMNRMGSLGPAAGKRSRGDLVLEALDHPEARDAAQAMRNLNPNAYRPFNLFIGGPRGAFWLRHRDSGIEVLNVPPGLHMLTARELDDKDDPRIRTYLPRFTTAATPNPQAADWDAWRSQLSSRWHPSRDGPTAAMNIETAGGFGTVSSSLIAIPAYPGFNARPIWLFAAGPPDREAFLPVSDL